MATIKDIQIGEETFKFNKLQSDNAVVEVVGDTINNFANKLQFGRHVDTSNSENLLVVGNGSSQDSTSNALELTYNGELKAQTDVVAGENKLTEKLDKENLPCGSKGIDIVDIEGEEISNIYYSDDSYEMIDLSNYDIKSPFEVGKFYDGSVFTLSFNKKTKFIKSLKLDFLPFNNYRLNINESNLKEGFWIAGYTPAPYNNISIYIHKINDNSITFIYLLYYRAYRLSTNNCEKGL